MNRAIFLAALTLLLAGCTQVEKGTGRALNNANGVVTTYAPKVWGPGETPPQTETVIDPVTGEKKIVEKKGS